MKQVRPRKHLKLLSKLKFSRLGIEHLIYLKVLDRRMNFFSLFPHFLIHNIPRIAQFSFTKNCFSLSPILPSSLPSTLRNVDDQSRNYCPLSGKGLWHFSQKRKTFIFSFWRWKHFCVLQAPAPPPCPPSPPPPPLHKRRNSTPGD